MDRNYYEILEVPVCASPDVVEAAYIKRRRLVELVRAHSPGRAILMSRESRAAYEFLMDRQKKAAYDRALRKSRPELGVQPHELPAAQFQKNDEVVHARMGSGRVLRSMVEPDGIERVVVSFGIKAAKVRGDEVQLVHRPLPSERLRRRKEAPRLFGESVVRTTDGRYDSFPDHEDLDDESWS